jgi:hypothetical protein
VSEVPQVLDLMARATGTWLVVVCPDDAATQALRRTLAASLPEGVTFSGRTALLDGGRLSVVALDDETFDPDLGDHVLFRGCGSGDKANTWRDGRREMHL